MFVYKFSLYIFSIYYFFAFVILNDWGIIFYFQAEITENREYCVWLNHVPIAAPGAPVTLRQIDCGHGFRLEGSLLGLPPSEIQILDSGVVTIELRDNATDNVLMSALWEHVRYFFKN